MSEDLKGKRLGKKVFPMDAASQKPTRLRRDPILPDGAGVTNLAFGQQQQASFNEDDQGSPNTIAMK